MVADAESHRADDARLRDLIDARNALDSAAYQVERRLEELGEAVPVHEKARAEMLVTDARQAIKEEAPVDRLRSLTAELQQLYHGMGAGAAASAGAEGGTPGADTGTGRGPDDDVIDAEFTPTDE